MGTLRSAASTRDKETPARAVRLPVRARESGGLESATIDRMADQQPTPSVPLDQQLQEIGAQLAWVRDYL